MKFVIAAGGTGGHLFPGLAVGEVLLARGHEVMVLISEKEIDALATLCQQGGIAIGRARLFTQVLLAKREWERVFDATAEGLALIDEQGRVSAIAIRESVQPMFDAELMMKGREWRYEPATMFGKPVRYRKMIQLNISRN